MRIPLDAEAIQTRTGVERSDPQKVLNRDLDEFMAASLVVRMIEGKDKEAA